jgi:hypothetical protein
LDTSDIETIACGRKLYVILTKKNDLMVWGNLFKGMPQQQTEGFSVVSADEMFEGGKINQLELRYSIYGAIVEN